LREQGSVRFIEQEKVKVFTKPPQLAKGGSFEMMQKEIGHQHSSSQVASD
jgi:hypothetical protein